MNGLESNVRLINRPVWDVPLKLYYTTNLANEGGTNMYTEPRGDEREVSVDSVRVDDWVDEDIDFVKVDVEHSELHVLKSMENLLRNRRVNMILVESWKDQVDVFDYLVSFGYQPRRILGIDPDFTSPVLTREMFLDLFAKNDGYEDLYYWRE